MTKEEINEKENLLEVVYFLEKNMPETLAKLEAADVTLDFSRLAIAVSNVESEQNDLFVKWSDHVEDLRELFKTFSWSKERKYIVERLSKESVELILDGPNSISINQCSYDFDDLSEEIIVGIFNIINMT